jgi:hypothetical protein
MRRPAAVFACAVAVAGCGSGSKGLTRIEYAQRTDAICARYNQQTAQLRARGIGVERLASIAEQTLALFDHARARLRAVPPPREASALAQRWLVSLDRLRADVISIRDAARANDLAAVRTFAMRAQRDNDASNRMARRLGMQACSAA